MTSSRGVAPAELIRPGEELAAAIKALIEAGRDVDARERFGDLVARHQHRASRLALYYLRDRAESDEAVQDAFVKAFLNLRGFDATLSFEVWFTRILINGCLDRLKARARRSRWMLPWHDHAGTAAPAVGPSPEDAVLRGEARRALRAAIDRLPDRQRLVVVLTHLDGWPTSEVSALTGIRESTVRVHLFRAMKRLRRVLGGRPAAVVAVESEG
jgi:RNA polymerase sigma-70 factor (ECF subfamily)